MNFLKQLASEWYRHEGYFVRTNIKAMKRNRKGWDAELDILAHDPLTETLLHVETSSDALSWAERKKRFLKKFGMGRDDYEKTLGTKTRHIRKIAIVGYSRSTKADLNWGRSIEVVLVPEFLKQITSRLRSQRSTNEAVPETYPILRAIQMVLLYGI